MPQTILYFSGSGTPAKFLSIMDMETVPHGPGPYNSLAIGEVANTPTAAAVANAVADACGVRITDLPVTAEKVYQALKNRH